MAGYNHGKLHLAFIYSHKAIDKVDGKYKHEDYLVSIDDIEKVTGLDFLTDLNDKAEEKIEKKKAKEVWGK